HLSRDVGQNREAEEVPGAVRGAAVVGHRVPWAGRVGARGAPERPAGRGRRPRPAVQAEVRRGAPPAGVERRTQRAGRRKHTTGPPPQVCCRLA
ncbi:hypothetical protein HK405_001867, partial [Cladochytrium tenue]